MAWGPTISSVCLGPAPTEWWIWWIPACVCVQTLYYSILYAIVLVWVCAKNKKERVPRRTPRWHLFQLRTWWSTMDFLVYSSNLKPRSSRTCGSSRCSSNRPILPGSGQFLVEIETQWLDVACGNPSFSSQFLNLDDIMGLWVERVWTGIPNTLRNPSPLSRMGWWRSPGTEQGSIQWEDFCCTF